MVAGWIVFRFIFFVMPDLSVGHNTTSQSRREKMRKHLRLMVLVALFAFALSFLPIFASGYCDTCGYDSGGSTCNTICGGSSSSSSSSSTSSTGPSRPEPPTLQEWITGLATDIIPYGSTALNVFTTIASQGSLYSDEEYMGAPNPPYETDMLGNKLWH